MSQLTATPKCVECGAVKGHSVFCSMQSPEEVLKQLKTYYNEWLDLHGSLHGVIKRHRDEAVLWQGKHAILRHENNKLRKKLYPHK